MNELKPCAHCGGKAVFMQFRGVRHYIECSVCGMRTASHINKQFLADIWNHRPTAKVVNQEDAYDPTTLHTVTLGDCENCSRRVILGMHEYCPGCGKKLIWEEQE